MARKRKYLPDAYYQDIFTIPYSKLKEKGIRFLLFDLDNTVALLEEDEPNKKTKKLMESLKKDYQIVIFSNNTKKRVKVFADKLGVSYISLAMKPSLKGVRKILKENSCQKEELAIIGDQLLTDIRMGTKGIIYTILVDPLSNEDLKITKVHRLCEHFIYKKYKRENLLERGKYDA